MGIKSALKASPLIGSLINKLRPPQYVGSSRSYWEDRYSCGGNSGAGSYNRLAQFKADFLNEFVNQHNVGSVIEFGSGDGAQLALATYPCYIGIDVSQTAIEICRQKFAERPSYKFMHLSEVHDLQADLTLSLDVVYHLVEDDVFGKYMRQLFDTSTAWVIIYSSNKNRAEAAHVRHRKFTTWVSKNRPDFKLIQTVRNRYPYNSADPENTSFADFFVFRRI